MGAGQVKREIDTEKLLHWAYRDELPKGYRDGKGGSVAAISPMFRFADLGGPIDNWSKEPGFPVAMGTEPHPDALAVHAAVMALDDIVIKWPSAAEALLGDLFKYMTDAEKFAARSMRVQVAGLVAMHSRMGNRPIWQLDYNVVRLIGRDRKSPLRKGRGRRSAKFQGDLRLDVPPLEILSARFEYFAWHSALCELATTLDLIDHRPTKPNAPQQPWCYPDGALARVLSDAAGMNARELATGRLTSETSLPLKPKRGRVLSPLRNARHGPVRNVPIEHANDALTTREDAS